MIRASANSSQKRVKGDTVRGVWGETFLIGGVLFTMHANIDVALSEIYFRHDIGSITHNRRNTNFRCATAGLCSKATELFLSGCTFGFDLDQLLDDVWTSSHE